VSSFPGRAIILPAIVVVSLFASTTSTTTLTATPDPTTQGRITALTALVSPSTAAGSITFYDGTTILAIHALVNGQANLTTSLAVGTHKLRARYGGSTAVSGSVSAVLTQTGPTVPQNGFQPARIFGAGTSASAGTQSIINADFNADGFADLAMLNTATQSVAVQLNSGSRTFSTALNYSTASSPTAMVSGGFRSPNCTSRVWKSGVAFDRVWQVHSFRTRRCARMPVNDELIR